MNNRKVIFLSAASSFLSSLLLCSLFLNAGAVTITMSGAALPYKITFPSKSYPFNDSTAHTGIYTPWNGPSNGEPRWVYYNTQTDKGDSYYTYGWEVENNDVLTGWGKTALGGTTQIAHDYAASCPAGQVMTGYYWGQMGTNGGSWGNRYGLLPECAVPTPAHI